MSRPAQQVTIASSLVTSFVAILPAISPEIPHFHVPPVIQVQPELPETFDVRIQVKSPGIALGSKAVSN